MVDEQEPYWSGPGGADGPEQPEGPEATEGPLPPSESGLSADVPSNCNDVVLQPETKKNPELKLNICCLLIKYWPW